MTHEISVWRLKELLAELNDSEVLTPNAVGHLLITSADGEDLGFINLLAGQAEIEWFMIASEKRNEKTILQSKQEAKVIQVESELPQR